jgi:tetratricopeptide (TPR) repeat protein
LAGWEGTLALWDERYDETVRHARALLQANSNDPKGLVLAAAAAIMDGDDAGALSLLDSLPGSDPEGLAWRSVALLNQGRLLPAVAAAGQAQAAGNRYSLPAACLRLKASLLRNAPGTPVAKSPSAFKELEPSLRAALHPQATRWLTPNQHCVAVLDAVLQRFGGNRSSCPVLRGPGGGLERFRGPIPVRHLGRVAQHLLRTGGLEASLGRFMELESAHPKSPTVFTYLGEVLIWHGRLQEATTEFERALELDPRTKWAWIGLGACSYLAGDDETAHDVWRRGLKHTEPGPTLFIYRGESHRAAGRIAQAAEDLQKAAESGPNRLSTRINLALLEAAKGDAMPASQLADWLGRLVPGLVVDLEGRGALTAEDQDRIRFLEKFLRRMRGNRSTSMPMWFDLKGRPRFIDWRPGGSPSRGA